MAKRYVVAVSGGVDSVALLHMLATQPELDIVVAHFDHGIRDDSSDDAKFVGDLAAGYGFKFETKREELGKQASEELARERRYKFLRDVAARHNGRIITAHHADDVIETVAINATRGTGWRGLSVMDSDIVRPLLNMSKEHIINYAKNQGLKWREDSTNSSDKYMRNRIRHSNNMTDDEKLQVLALRSHQVGVKNEINKEVKSLVGEGPEYSRYFFTHIEQDVAIECLRFVTQARLTRPQLKRVLLAIKTLKSGATYDAGAGIKFKFTSRNFSLELVK